MTRGMHQPGNLQTESSGNGRANLFGIEQLPFDLGRFQYIERQSGQHGLCLQRETQVPHLSEQPALQVPDTSH